MRIKKMLAVVCVGSVLGTSVLPLVGCNNRSKVSDTDQTLEIFCVKLGYGVEWIEAITEEFKKQDWVKEKYPNLNVILETSGDRGAISSRLDAGEGVNTVDMVMSDAITIGTDNMGKEYSCNLTDVVYNTMVPGENVTVYEKLQPSYQKSLMYYKYGENSLYKTKFEAYDFNWASGMMGILYNEELLSSFGYTTPPRTTQEFMEACETIRDDSDYGKGFAIMWSTGAEYMYYLYNTWWAQYEGADNYYNYLNGVSVEGEDYYENSSDIFKQWGRKEALQTLIDICSTSNGYRYAKGLATDFMAAQKYFLKGEGVFMANGDWFGEEMQADMAQTKYTIKMMKTPIISSIIDKLTTVKTEEKLREVVGKIDEGYETATSAGLEGVSEADYKRVIEARSYVTSLGPGCSTFIPVYATGKQVAFDFLRFMATDKACALYTEKTGGASLPFQYDVLDKNPELYDDFYDLEKSRIDMEQNSVHGNYVLPYDKNFPLVKYGEVGLFSSYALQGGTIASYMQNGKSEGESSALAAYNRDLEYWTGNSASKWKNALRFAGYLK